MAAAKARGVKLGNPKGAAALRRSDNNGRSLRATVAQNAESFARSLAPVLADIRAASHTTLRAIAVGLNTRGIRTRRGGQLQVSNVRNLLRRLDQPVSA